MYKASSVVLISACWFFVIYAVFLVQWMVENKQYSLPFISTIVFDTYLYYPMIIAGFILAVLMIFKCQKVLAVFLLLVTMSFYKQEHDPVHTLWVLFAALIGLLIAWTERNRSTWLVVVVFFAAFLGSSLKISFSYTNQSALYTTAAVCEHIFFISLAVVIYKQLKTTNN